MHIWNTSQSLRSIHMFIFVLLPFPSSEDRTYVQAQDLWFCLKILWMFMYESIVFEISKLHINYDNGNVSSWQNVIWSGECRDYDALELVIYTLERNSIRNGMICITRRVYMRASSWVLGFQNLLLRPYLDLT